MTAVLIGTFEPGSPDWHAARSNGLGGSEISSVLGLSPWESRFSLWHRKKQLIGDVVENDEMYWGKRLEDDICDEFTLRHPELEVAAAGTYHHAERPWQIANPDRLITGRSLLEAKTARDDFAWGKPGTDNIPVYYKAQVLWYLDVFGYTDAFVAVLIGGSDYREYLVVHDEAEAAFMRDRAHLFMKSLWADERPDIDAHAATYQAVRELHPDIDGEDVEIDPRLAQHYRMANAIAKRAESRVTYYKSRVSDAVGSGRRAVSGGERVAIRVAGRAGAIPHLRPAQNRKAAS